MPTGGIELVLRAFVEEAEDALQDGKEGVDDELDLEFCVEVAYPIGATTVVEGRAEPSSESLKTGTSSCADGCKDCGWTFELVKISSIGE